MDINYETSCYFTDTKGNSLEHLNLINPPCLNDFVSLRHVDDEGRKFIVDGIVVLRSWIYSRPGSKNYMNGDRGNLLYIAVDNIKMREY